MRYRVSYTWHLNELMARKGIKNAQELTELLEERGITLSRQQVWRMVSQDPERISLQVMTALCHILDANQDQLIQMSFADAKTPRTPLRPTADGDKYDIGNRRPLRAVLNPEDGD